MQYIQFQLAYINIKDKYMSYSTNTNNNYILSDK